MGSWDNFFVTTLQARPAVCDDAPPAVRRPIAFVSWGAVAGRSAEIAQALGGESRCFFPKGSSRRPPVFLRYLLCAAGTAWYLLRRRPRVVVVTNPPVPAAWFTAACARMLGASVILDSHPGGFGAQGDRVAARLQFVHRRLVRRAAAVMVTGEEWSERVRAWGGRPVVVHEAPSAGGGRAPTPGSRLRLLVVGNFHRDEPVAAVLDAARTVPECDFLVTGEPSRCPPGLLEAAADNVQLVGFLDPARYRAALQACDAVVTLTTEPTSVMRAAYEAVYHRRPAIVSDWPVARRLFPYAVHSANDASSLAAAIGRLRSDYRRFADLVDVAREEQVGRWEDQRRDLAEIIDRLLETRWPHVVLDAVDAQATAHRIVTGAARGRGGRMANVNVDTLRLALADEGTRHSINECDLVLADGVPIVWATRLQGSPVPERVAASELIWPTCELAARHHVGVFLLGGAPTTAARAAETLGERFLGLAVDHLCPPFGFEDDDAEMELVVKALEAARPGIVFCGFGTPKQERLMALLTRRFPSMWFIACGGTFAMLCGDLPQAPTWMRRSSLEWLHRLRLEPRRLFGRYIVRDLPFAPKLFAASAAARVGRPARSLVRVRHTSTVVPMAGRRHTDARRPTRADRPSGAPRPGAARFPHPPAWTADHTDWTPDPPEWTADPPDWTGELAALLQRREQR